MSDIPLVIEAMRERLGVQFDGLEFFDTPDGDKIGFYVAFIRGARVYFDHEGQPWMNEASITSTFKTPKQTINSALSRYSTTKQAQRLGRVLELRTHDQIGRNINVTLFDEFMVSSIVIRSQDPTDEALEFIEEREWIVRTARNLVFEYGSRADEQNARLRAALGEAELKAHHLTVDLEARWEQELQVRYPEEF